MLTLIQHWCEDGRRFARWCPASQAALQRLKPHLEQQLTGHLSARCAHLKGRGGVKGAVRYVDKLTDHYPFVARFDIRAYYESIDHAVLLAQLREARVDPISQRLVRDYLALPDRRCSGKGMVAGGAISPLLGALYLTPLDEVMQALAQRLGIRYQRFMDDWVILAPSRHKLRVALRRMYAVLDDLRLEVHPDKRFIGRTTRGFDFLGYRFHPGRKLCPARQSLDRLFERARRLHEQGAALDRLRQYVQRWFSWLHGGLRGRVSRHGRCQRIWDSRTSPTQSTKRKHPAPLTAAGGQGCGGRRGFSDPAHGGGD